MSSKGTGGSSRKPISARPNPGARNCRSESAARESVACEGRERVSWSTGYRETASRVVLHHFKPTQSPTGRSSLLNPESIGSYPTRPSTRRTKISRCHAMRLQLGPFVNCRADVIYMPDVGSLRRDLSCHVLLCVLPLQHSDAARTAGKSRTRSVYPG